MISASAAMIPKEERMLLLSSIPAGIRACFFCDVTRLATDRLQIIPDQIPDADAEDRSPLAERGKLRVRSLVEQSENILVVDFQHLGETALRYAFSFEYLAQDDFGHYRRLSAASQFSIAPRLLRGVWGT